MRITPRLLREIDDIRSKNGMIIEEEKSLTMYIPIKFNNPIQKIQNDNNISPLLNLTITELYPFKVPEVKYFDKDIRDIYKVHLQKELQELLEKNRVCILCKKNNCQGCYCMCCSTIICSNNWNPHMKLIDIINEFERFIDIKCRLIERIHCKKVQDKYLPQISLEYLPIYNYL